MLILFNKFKAFYLIVSPLPKQFHKVGAVFLLRRLNGEPITPSKVPTKLLELIID